MVPHFSKNKTNPTHPADHLTSVAATAAKLKRLDTLTSISTKHYTSALTSAWRVSQPAAAADAGSSDPTDVATWVGTWVDSVARLVGNEVEFVGAAVPEHVENVLEKPFVAAVVEAAR